MIQLCFKTNRSVSYRETKYFLSCLFEDIYSRDCRHDHMVVGFTTTCAICLSPLKLWVRTPFLVRCTWLCDKVCEWLAAGWWFSLGTPVSSINKTDRHDINEILLKVALNTIKQTKHGKMMKSFAIKVTLHTAYTLIFFQM